MSYPATCPHGRSASLHCGGFPPPPSARLPRALLPLSGMGAWPVPTAPANLKPGSPLATFRRSRRRRSFPLSRESRRLLRPPTGGKAAQQRKALGPSASATLQPKCPPWSPAVAPAGAMARHMRRHATPGPLKKRESLGQTKEVSSLRNRPLGGGYSWKRKPAKRLKGKSQAPEAFSKSSTTRRMCCCRLRGNSETCSNTRCAFPVGPPRRAGSFWPSSSPTLVSRASDIAINCSGGSA